MRQMTQIWNESKGKIRQALSPPASPQRVDSRASCSSSGIPDTEESASPPPNKAARLDDEEDDDDEDDDDVDYYEEDEDDDDNQLSLSRH